MKRVRRCRIPGRGEASGAAKQGAGFEPGSLPGQVWTALNAIERSILPRRISLAGDAGTIDLAVCEGRLCGMPRIDLADGAGEAAAPGLNAPVWRGSTPSERQALLRGSARALSAFCAGTSKITYTISPTPDAREAGTSFSAIDLAQAMAPDIHDERDGTVAAFWPMMKADQGWLLSAQGWPRKTSGPVPEDMDIDNCATAAQALGKWREAAGSTAAGPTMIVATMGGGDSDGLWCLATDGESAVVGSYRRTMLASILWAWRYAVGNKASGDAR